MPEHGAAPAGAIRELILADRVDQLPPGIPWVAFRDAAVETGGSNPALGEILRPHRGRLRTAFVEWLGNINRANASAAWWAHATTAKNMLSSPFGERVFDLLGLRLLVEGSSHARIGVVGASAAQAATLAMWANARGAVRITGEARGTTPDLFFFPGMLYQLLRVMCAWARWLRGMRMPAAPGIHVFSYADSGFDGGSDAFFGPLADLLAREDPPVAARFHVFIHGKYRDVAPRLRASRGRYAPAFAELTAGDMLAAFRATVAALGQAGRWPHPEMLEGIDFEPVLREALREDVAGGGHFLNMLVGAAARRIGRRLNPAAFLYPYENKSLEKLLLLGLRESCPGIRIVGYQHTSVTPRHTTLLFAAGEAERTPLPERIVTCGAVTLAYLERYGRYPAGMLAEGFALRQPQRAPLERRVPDGTKRILLVLSSSVHELRCAVRWLLEAAGSRTDLRLAVRPHHEFPLALLPEGLRTVLAAKADDFSGSRLEENLAWADVVVYASSTVGLEALMAGRPVVNLDLGESLESDPVIEPVALHSRAASAQELVAAVDAIGALEDAEYALRQRAARDFVGRYFRAYSEQRLEMLVKIPPR